MKESITINEVLNVLKKRAIMIVLLVIAAILLAGGVTYYIMTPVYQSTAQILVNQTPTGTEQVNNDSIATDLQLINTYSDIIKSPAILEPVIEQLKLNLTADQLNNKIVVNSTEESQVVSISVSDPDRGEAVDIANKTAEVLVAEVKELMNANNVIILSPAVVKRNSEPVSPNLFLNVGIAAFSALLLGVGLAFLMDHLDTTITDSKDIKKELGIPVVGIISPIAAKENESLVGSRSLNQREA